MATIYHITTAELWQTAQPTGSYEAPSLAAEGFIHCSVEDQLAGVLDRYFSGQTGLVKLRIDSALLVSPLIYEWSDSVSDTFPHVYGPINTDAVEEVISVG